MAKSSTTSTKTPAKKKAPAKKAVAKKAPAKKAVAQTKAPLKTNAVKKTAPAAKKPRPTKFKKVSRCVTRLVEPGSQVDCMYCDERVKFQAKMRHQQVICNVYEKHKWVRVEHFHADCYKLAKRPFGKPVD